MTKYDQPEDGTMDKERELKSTRRREFLKFAGVGTLAGATAAAGGASSAEAATAPTDEARGYRETEHVKTFYRLARF